MSADFSLSDRTKRCDQRLSHRRSRKMLPRKVAKWLAELKCSLKSKILPLSTSAKSDTFVEISRSDQSICDPYLLRPQQLKDTKKVLATWLSVLRGELIPRILPLRNKRYTKPISLKLTTSYAVGGGTGGYCRSDQIEQELCDLNDFVSHKSDFNCFARRNGVKKTPSWQMKERMKRKMELKMLFKEFEETKRKCAKLSRCEGPVNLDWIDRLQINLID